MESNENIHKASDAPVSGAVAGVDGQPRKRTHRNNSPEMNQTEESHQGVLATHKLATTKLGKPRQRMKWTEDMNISIMRCYFKATNNERNLVMYRQRMHEYFKEEYPDLEVSEQRVVDQRRAIVTHALLPKATIETIKQELYDQHPLNNEAIQNQTQQYTAEGNEAQESTVELPMSQSGGCGRAQKVDDQDLRNELESTFIKYYGTDPTKRPYIPRQSTSVRLARTVEKVNTILPEYFERIANDPTSLNSLIFCAAIVCSKYNGAKIIETNENEGTKHSPKWRIRLELKIAKLRTEVNRLTLYKRGERSKKLVNEVERLFRSRAIHTKHETDNATIEDVLDTTKQKLTAMAKRLKRYKDCTKRKMENRLFQERESQFYKKLKQTTLPGKPPSREEIEDYWKELWSREVHHNMSARWIKTEINRVTDVKDMEFQLLSEELLKRTIDSTHNWKAPGIDNIHNFWYKKFTSTHRIITQHMNTIIQNPEAMPEFYTTGITYLLPKNELTTNPANYRPITCLPTIYKILTACISKLIYEHCENNDILYEQQKGCRKNSQGCKEQLTIDNVVMSQAYKDKRNIYTAYIDYRKAFDSIPHSWLAQILKIYKISPVLSRFLLSAMGKWTTSLRLQSESNYIITEPINIRRGIFQGDALSPLWFCLGLNPLSGMLNESGRGFNIKHRGKTLNKLSHLMYMDDIKIYSSTPEHLKQLLKITETFSRDIQMGFGLEKCRVQNINQGKRKIDNYSLQNEQVIESMQEGDTYKYLGMCQSRVMEEKQVKEGLLKTYISRVREITRTKLNSRNLIKAINTYAVPTLGYSFGVIRWTETDIDDIQRKTRKLLTECRYHHPKSAIERLTLPRHLGGRGLIDLSNFQNKQKTNLKQYFISRSSTSKLHQAIVLADSSYTPLNMGNDTMFSTITEEQKLEQWSRKALHGKHFNDLNQANVDINASNTWLTEGKLFPETEGFMLAIQDQVLNTRNYRKHIVKDGTEDDRCRMCNNGTENIVHIISGCQSIAQTEYKARHDNVAKIIHQALARKYGIIKESVPYYKYTPAKVLENDAVKIYWDRGIITDKQINHNRPDLTLIQKSTRTTYFVDIAIPATANLQTTQTTKITKYTDLAIEVQQQWHMNTVKTIPIVLSATGIIPNTLKTNLKKLEIDENIFRILQRAVILDTCRMTRKFLNNTQ